ncbi:MAG: TlpA disulfide reductase family protein [Acidobacteriota bacterium]
MVNGGFGLRLGLAVLLMAALAGVSLLGHSPRGNASWVAAQGPGEFASEPPEALEPEGALKIGDEVPPFDLPLIGGGRLALEDLGGEGPVLLVVWAVWCPPCIDEFRELNRLHERYADQGLRILAVGVRYQQSLEEIQRFAREQAVNFTVLYDEREKVVQRYGVEYIPSNFLIDKDGTLRFSDSGLPSDLEERIQALLS